MLSSIGLDLSVSLSLILPLSNWLNVVQSSFHCWIGYVFRYKWDQGCAFLFRWVAKLFYNRHQRLNMTYEARLTSPGLLIMWCASLVGVAPLVYCSLKLFYHSCQLRSSNHRSQQRTRILSDAIIPPFLLINSLFCSWAWSSGIDEKILAD